MSVWWKKRKKVSFKRCHISIHCSFFFFPALARPCLLKLARYFNIDVLRFAKIGLTCDYYYILHSKKRRRQHNNFYVLFVKCLEARGWWPKEIWREVPTLACYHLPGPCRYISPFILPARPARPACLYGPKVLLLLASRPVQFAHRQGLCVVRLRDMRHFPPAQWWEKSNSDVNR